MSQIVVFRRPTRQWKLRGEDAWHRKWRKTVALNGLR
jgi:hypothetical protein